MTGIDFALWGAFGGFCVEGLDFAATLRRCGDWPWKVKGESKFGPLFLAAIIRISISAGVAAAAGLGNTVTGVFGAVAAGIAAPLIVEKAGKTAAIFDFKNSDAVGAVGEMATEGNV